MNTAEGLGPAGGARQADRCALEHLGGASSLVREVVEGGHPKLVTQNGRVVAAIVDARTYHALRGAAAQQLLQDLQTALAQSEAGELVEHDEVFGDIRERLRGRVSPDTQRQLDAL